MLPAKNPSVASLLTRTEGLRSRSLRNEFLRSPLFCFAIKLSGVVRTSGEQTHRTGQPVMTKGDGSDRRMSLAEMLSARKERASAEGSPRGKNDAPPILREHPTFGRYFKVRR